MIKKLEDLFISRITTFKMVPNAIIHSSGLEMKIKYDFSKKVNLKAGVCVVNGATKSLNLAERVINL